MVEVEMSTKVGGQVGEVFSCYGVLGPSPSSGEKAGRDRT